MNKIKGVLRNKLRERPFDFYVAALLFAVGIYGIISDSWPESVGVDWANTIIVIISLYLMFAGAVIMLSLGCQRKKYPVLSLIGEMYGWLFVCSASVAIMLTEVGALAMAKPTSWWEWGIMMGVWGGLLLSSFIRFIDLYIVYRRIHNNG
jgi:hypothetical protein